MAVEKLLLKFQKAFFIKRDEKEGIIKELLEFMLDSKLSCDDAL